MDTAGLINMKEINLKILNKEQWKYTKISNFIKFKFNSTPNNFYKKKQKIIAVTY